MAGNYPDVPGHRFVMDRDGTQIYRISPTNVISQLTPTQVQGVQDESDSTITPNVGGPTGRVVVYFPEQRSISGIFARGSSAVPSTPLYPMPLEYSENTTNGLDGTWTSTSAIGGPGSVGAPGVTIPDYRALITPLALSNVRALRISSAQLSYDWHLRTLHIYGSIPTAGSPNRLAIWNPALDEPIGGAYFDWGDSPRSSSADRTFRVKNLSGSLTANNITVSFDALTDGAPAVAGMHLVSDDGTTFAATELIASLAPGAISSVLTLRRVLPSNAPLGLWAPRIHAVADTWS